MGLFSNILLSRPKGIYVTNASTLLLFDNRLISPPPVIIGSTEYLTGVNQQPDLGTYTGNVNDLTETEITNLSNGTDYNGLGTNVIWSTLEKVWVLESLETTGTSGVLRYGFNFIYDSGLTVVQVPNGGALGLPGVTDWINPTNNLGENWTDLGDGTWHIFIIYPSVPGWVGNVQAALGNAFPETLRVRNSVNLNASTAGVLSFRASVMTLDMDVYLIMDDDTLINIGTALAGVDAEIIGLQYSEPTYSYVKHVQFNMINADTNEGFAIDEVQILEL